MAASRDATGGGVLGSNLGASKLRSPESAEGCSTPPAGLLRRRAHPLAPDPGITIPSWISSQGSLLPSSLRTDWEKAPSNCSVNECTNVLTIIILLKITGLFKK